MFLDSRNNLYKFNFPKSFIPQEIEDKYKKYITKVLGSPIDSVYNLINYTIQGINLSGTSFDVVEQTAPHGESRTFRTAAHPQTLYNKELTVTMKMLDGFLNYWILLDVLEYYYAYERKEKFIPDLRIEILNADGHVMTNINLERVMLTSIGDLDLNFSSNVVDFNTFDITLVYNVLSRELMFDSSY